MTKWYTCALCVLISFSLVGCSLPSSAVSYFSGEVPPVIASSASPVEVTNYLGHAREILDVSNLSFTEKATRTAAVKVKSLLESGHGSGTYLIMFGRRVVVTAAHVVNNDTTMLVEGRDDESVIGRVVFRDDRADLAFIVVPEIKSRTAIRYKPHLSYDDRMIGANLTYTGFPSHHDLLTIRGYVAALEHDYIVTNMFGWFGSSGSGVFDQRGRLVGVVSGIDVGRYLMPIPLEEIVWVAPISKIDHEMLRVRILTAEPPALLKTFPGAATPRRGEAPPG